MDTIKCMGAFAAVASQQSFTAGARQLGLSTKVVSKYVKQLEEKLGAQLFHRTTRSVTLTDIGHAYYERCQPLLDQFDELEGLVQERQSELAGPIRITAPTGFGSRELPRAIQTFQQSHPKVNIELYLSDHLVSLVEQRFDLAIRFGELADSSLLARKLLDMAIVVVASPEYLSRYGRPRHPHELSSHNCLLQNTSSDPEHWHFSINNKTESVRVAGNFRANAPRAKSHMALGDMGIARCPLYVVREYIASNQLEILFPEYQSSEIGLYGVYPPGRHLSARIRTLIDHLAEYFNTADFSERN